MKQMKVGRSIDPFGYKVKNRAKIHLILILKMRGNSLLEISQGLIQSFTLSDRSYLRH